jgi:hypothetical protein
MKTKSILTFAAATGLLAPLCGLHAQYASPMDEAKPQSSETIQCDFSHDVTGSGVVLDMPASFTGPIQSIVQVAEQATLEESIIEDNLRVGILDMRGTESPLQIQGTLTPLENSGKVRPTTVEVIGWDGSDTEGVRANDILAAKVYTEKSNFIEADALVNRSFTAVLRITAGAISGRDVLTGSYAGNFYLEVQ